MKVVWLCHFTNQEVQALLKPFKKLNEFAPWIPNLAKVFEEKSKEIEIHIVSPHEYITNYKCIKLRNINYHFYNPHIPVWGRHWPVFFKFDILCNYWLNKHIVKRIINKINPDLIHLHGAENAYYSSTIIQFKKVYPVLVTIQGFISHATQRCDKQHLKKVKVEQEILTSFKHFGYRTKTMGENIRKFNPRALLHWHEYAVELPKPINVEKIYDLVFFAQISKEKGIDDLLQAVSIIKERKSDISLCVIGSGNIAIWKDRAKMLNISKNIYWAGFLPTQKEVHKMASSARISVLPTYFDIISGTISESLFLKLPVVAYSVGSIHEVNKNGKIITLVEKFDVVGLANGILNLINDRNMQLEIGEKGYKRAYEMFGKNIKPAKIYSDLRNAYSDIIKTF